MNQSWLKRISRKIKSGISADDVERIYFEEVKSNEENELEKSTDASKGRIRRQSWHIDNVNVDIYLAKTPDKLKSPDTNNGSRQSLSLFESMSSNMIREEYNNMNSRPAEINRKSSMSSLGAPLSKLQLASLNPSISTSSTSMRSGSKL